MLRRMVEVSARRPLIGRWDPLTIGIDIGGTKVLAGVVDVQGRVLARLRRSTPGTSVEAVEDTVIELVTTLRQQYPISAVGIGAAGFVDVTRSVVTFSPHLAWRDEPLRAAVAARAHLPVVVDNDANAAALAEARFGAGRGHRFVLCVTLGTGIGGALVLDNKVFRGANGMAGEFGHMQVVRDGHRCPCGNRGCWEQYASGNALGHTAREVAAQSPAAAADLLDRVEGDASRLTGEVVARAAAEGDPLAMELLSEVGTWLGQGIADLSAILDPDVGGIGGGVSVLGETILGPARDRLERALPGRGFRPGPRVVAAELGAQAGLVGAADLVRREVAEGQ